MAERICGGTVCDSPVAGGIGGMGCGTQRRFKWIVLYVDPVEVRGLRARSPAYFGAVCVDSGFVCAGFDV